MNPEISVIMSVYSETKDLLQKSIDSILDQSFTNFEFVIVLDNPENTEAKNYILQRQKEDSRIVFLKNEENIKLGASLNKGIAHARGNYIARMDGDDICDTSKLEKQHEYISTHKNIDLLFTGWEEIDEEGNKKIRIPLKKDFENIHKTFFYKSPILHASMLCKRKVFETYTYPEIDRPEDFSLFLDLIHAGYNFDVIEENLYTFYIQNFDLQTKYKKIHIFSSNFIKILSKNIIKFWNNIYFWWMFFLVIIQWILSRNYFVFSLFFVKLQKFYTYLFVDNK